MKSNSHIGIAGLAVMGENLVLNLASKGYTVSVFNRTTATTDNFLNARARGKTIVGHHTLKEFAASLKAPRKIMMMLKAGKVVDDFISQLLPFLDENDIIIDGGNSYYHDTARRAADLENQGFHYIGTGVSGGEEGALKGPSIMPGGSFAAWKHVQPIFNDAAAKTKDGTPCCDWMGNGGAGHFVKTVHNGIEYADMQLICESFHVMKTLFGMSAVQIHDTITAWNNTDLNSYLIEITADIMAVKDSDDSPMIDKILDAAGQKGTGKWTVNTALDLGTPLSLISESVFARCLSAKKEERINMSKILGGPQILFKGDLEQYLLYLKDALLAAKIISYSQGFSLLRDASMAYDWQLPFGSIAKIWRKGCIIRSVFLDRISHAYLEDPSLSCLLASPYFGEKIEQAQAGLRKIVALCIENGIPAPCHASALSYYDAFRSAWLPANLLQAQRDYFGAHTYERTDKPRGEFFHTNWTGKGGNTTSTSYIL